jgi:hypothetical protein
MCLCLALVLLCRQGIDLGQGWMGLAPTACLYRDAQKQDSTSTGSRNTSCHASVSSRCLSSSLPKTPDRLSTSPPPVRVKAANDVVTPSA